MNLLVKGDKAIVRIPPKKVTIRQAGNFLPCGSWNYNYYVCGKCKKHITPGQLYGRTNKSETFCLNCCEEGYPE